MPWQPTESWIERAARLHPRRAAVADAGATLTFQQLELASRRAAAGLAARGAGPGDQVALQLTAGAAFAAALHGCLRAGVVAVPIDPRLPAAQQAERADGCIAAVSDAEASAWLTQPEAGADGPERSPGESRAGDHAPRPLAGSGADAETPAVRLFTSGTTGPGTPVLLSRGALLWNTLGSAAALGRPPHERWLSAMPVAHVGGLSVFARSAIGATCAVVRPRFDLDEQRALLQAGEATITSLVPTMLARLLDAGLAHPPNLRLVLLGGAPIAPELLRRAGAAGIRVAATYGLSEAASQVLVDGRPLFCTQAVLRGELPAGAPAPHGEDPGELLVRSPTLASGAAGPGGWLATGDRLRRAADGTLSVAGRIAETIVTGGENVAPTEVEAALLAQPAIADAAALAVSDPDWGERVEARVVLRPGHELDEPALREALRGTLAPYAIPKRITVVSELPRTPTGKLIRRSLR